ncbi:MAG: twin-arginine translocase TatA/TatE family subunit [Thermoplasmata archaeon]|nr:MAG: twin-arginine translocase TatA/TatE family subunit [Thermoplasmata archaeon]
MAFAGMEWIIVIIVVVLLLFGAKKIPELARSMGKARAEFSRGQQMVEKELREAERLEKEEDAKREMEEAKRRQVAEKAVEEDVDEEDDIDPDVKKAAKALGIEPEGKTEEELKVLIKYKMEQG